MVLIVFVDVDDIRLFDTVVGGDDVSIPGIRLLFGIVVIVTLTSNCYGDG